MDIKQRRIERILWEFKDLFTENCKIDINIKYLECDYKNNNVLPKVDETWQQYKPGMRLSGYDKHFWLFTEFETGDISENSEYRLRMTVDGELQCDSRHPQGIIYINGKLWQGFDGNHTDCDLLPNTKYQVYIYLYLGLFEMPYEVNARIIEVNRDVEKFYYDILVPYEACDCFFEDDYERMEILKHLCAAANLLDLTKYKSPEFYASVKLASQYLEDNFYGKYMPHPSTVCCIGHTHIDVAWLWTYAQTKEKVQRSFATMLRLMEKYPEYKFMISQPQLLEYLKEEAPECYAKIKELVRMGRIDIDGAMWVEADCNLSSGESLIRQIIYGKKFIKDEFEKDSRILWLPDVFGYAAALPQILKKCGVDTFVTSKICWNETNKMPYDIFRWQGIDGTDIMTHFIVGQDYDKTTGPVTYTSYVGRINPKFVLGTWKRFQQKEYTTKTFISYGWGDGGGGPTADMLEKQRRLSKGILGIPQTKTANLETTLLEIQEDFNKNAQLIRKIPMWKGELYLEFHRGTYTTIGGVKKYNRKCEFACQNLEKLAIINSGINEYPKTQLDRFWKTVLLNQFHDVVPGSSIEAVYEDSFRMYEELLTTEKALEEKMVNGIAENVDAPKGTLLAVNLNGCMVDTVAENENGLVSVKNVPPLGWIEMPTELEESKVKVSNSEVENEFYKVIFDKDYNIISLYDKRYSREVIKEGEKANQLRMYEDLPYSYDAWDISEYHVEKMQMVNDVISVEILNEGARAGLKIKKKFKESVIEQKIYLYNELDRIDFDTYIDWHQRHMILKAAFPVDVNTNKATYEIQFGNIEREHTKNNSWDSAKFETCAHKWVDISDGGYGMALMNDCKYGYSVVDDSTIQLSLLRGSDAYDEYLPKHVNDQGEHYMSYSIVPHEGDFRAGNIVAKAYAFNNPVKTIMVSGKGKKWESKYSLIKTVSRNIIIDTVKKAENENATVVRLYECYNRKGTVTLECGFKFTKAYLCDMMENRIKELQMDKNIVKIELSGFEIATILFEE